MRRTPLDTGILGLYVQTGDFVCRSAIVCKARKRNAALRAEFAAVPIVTSVFRAAHRRSPKVPQADARVSPEHRSKKTDERTLKWERQ
jgi:hypothetical protein